MRNFYLVLGAVSALAIASAAACTTDDSDGAGGSGGGTTSSGTGGTTSSGTGGSTSSGTGGGAACAFCSDYALGDATSEELCGYQGVDPDTGELLCDAASSCELLADLQACTCTGDSTVPDGCLDMCGDNACLGDDPTTDCEDCIFTVCIDEANACTGDF